MAVKVTGINEFNAKLLAYQKRLNTPKEKTAILAAGGAKVRQQAAKAPTPKSSASKKPQPTAPHYYYTKFGRVEINSGNLRKSMKVYRGRDGDVYVGPRVLRRITGDIGKTAKTSSGYYAAAIAGSARAFRAAYMEPALGKATGAALQAIEKQFAKWHNQNRPQ